MSAVLALGRSASGLTHLVRRASSVGHGFRAYCGAGQLVVLVEAGELHCARCEVLHERALLDDHA